MARLSASIRLKVKEDTLFLPGTNGGVFFRNNESSFHMEGGTIFQWVERLVPLLDGTNSLEELTDGLPDAHRDRVYEIASVLYSNGFVRDASQDLPHQLSDAVQARHASQIALLDNLGGSGARRFQAYREAKVLAVGSGRFFVSLVAALLESGQPKPSLLITGGRETDRQRIAELAAHARKTDPDVELAEVEAPADAEGAWREVVQPFDFVLYVAEELNLEELRRLQAACQAGNTAWLPAVCAMQAGLAGPLVLPESTVRFESAWRRLHRFALCKDPQEHAFSSTAAAMLANLIVFECLTTAAGVADPRQQHQCFLMNLETLEGNWHSFLPHPSVADVQRAERWEAFEKELERGQPRALTQGVFHFFNSLVSQETGIFQHWDEGELRQLPMSLCRVQAVDLLADGPADVLDEVVCAGMTHEEARLEAALCGVESYVAHWVEGHREDLFSDHVEQQERIGVGTGTTVGEGIGRGLIACLDAELAKQVAGTTPAVSLVDLGKIEDDRCRYYLKALTTMQAAPAIGFGEDVRGFPVAWVGTGGCWHGSVGLNRTFALRRALQQALLKVQEEDAYLAGQTTEVSRVLAEGVGHHRVSIPSCAEGITPEDMRTAMQVLEENGMQILVFDLALEPFLRDALACVVGVLLREEEPA